MEYQKQLLKRLLQMIEDNEKEKFITKVHFVNYQRMNILMTQNIEMLGINFQKTNKEHIGMVGIDIQEVRLRG